MTQFYHGPRFRPPVTLKCQYCGKPFTVHIDRTKRWCSFECGTAYRINRENEWRDERRRAAWRALGK